MSDVPVRLLRESLREDGGTAPSTACLDADTLAAWADGALRAADRAAAESHAATCARCQAMVAAMAITAPPAPAPQWWRARIYTWAPLAAAAAAAVLWFAVPRPPVAPQAAHPPAAVAEAPAAREPRAAGASNDQRAADRIAPSSPGVVSPQLRADGRSARSAAVAAPRLPSAAPVGVDAFALSAVPPPAPPPAAPPEPTATPPAASSAASPPAPLEETVAVAPNATESVQLRSRRAEAAAPAQALAKTSPSFPEIVSPDRNVRWRLRIAGSVDRSTDGGSTWQTQATGFATPLVNGAAPTPTICWVVGKGGIVLRSTDGATWQRVGLPDAIDLTAIRASDAINATVTAADGRVFTTGDGGTTWRSR